MKRLEVCVFLLVLVLGEVLMCCEGCLKQERQALIALNSQLENSLSWADNITTADCCQWIGVECNTINGRIAKLELNVGGFFYFGARQINYSDFIIFKDLKSLDLSGVRISNCIKTDQGYLFLIHTTHFIFSFNISITKVNNSFIYVRIIFQG
jgi:hypothetical protein